MVRGEEPPPSPAPAQPAARAWPEIRDETFTLVWQVVYESYFDPTFGGVDWLAVRDRYAAEAAKATDQTQLRAVLRRMLAELHSSHFGLLPRDAAVFHPRERARIGTVGLEVAWLDDHAVVCRVQPESPAAKADIHPGDVLTEVDGATLDRLADALTSSDYRGARRAAYLAQTVNGRLHPGVGKTVKLAVRAGDAPAHGLELKSVPHPGEWSEPIGDFPSSPLDIEARRDDDGIAYLRFNSFSPRLMKPIRALLAKLQPTDGLIIDLRGNPGGVLGMANGICGWLSKEEFSLGKMHLRQGMIVFVVTPQEGAFTGPIAVLIDSRSASTSEVLAAGLQEAKRARIFGERSAGAALPSQFRPLPTGDLFQYAVADLQTPGGWALEGRGVQPNEPVSTHASDLAAGRDAVVLAARAWIARERHAATPPAVSAPPAAGTNSVLP
jgi:carboxyl-terminal processing protease